MSTRRTLSYAGLAILIVVYLLVIQGLGVALSQGTDAGYGTFPDLDTVLRAITTPVAVSVLFVAVVISVMRIWPEVLHENHPVRQWVWVVPGLMVVGALVVLDYENLGAADSGLLIATVVTSLLVGVGEELMFRGVLIQTLRDNGMVEHRVALWSSVIFGGAHITNIISEGGQAVIQVIVVSVAGFFFYLSYRVSGTIVVPILLHAFWDFAQFSHNVGVTDPEVRATQFVPLVALAVAGLVVYVRRDSIEPAAA